MPSFPTDHGDAGVWGPELYNWLTFDVFNSDGSFKRRPVTIGIKVFDDATTVTTGDGKAYLFVTDDIAGFNLTTVRAFVSTNSSSGLVTVQINNVTDAVDMLTTSLTIDANESGSTTAATAAVIDSAHDDVTLGDKLRIDVDAAGTGAKGLEVALTFGP